MSKDWYQDIVDFHFAMGHHVSIVPGEPNPKTTKLRVRLIKEEVGELLAGLRAGDLEAVADGGADAIVVILGTMISYGIDLRPIWDEVHKTNMAKQGGGKDAGGKSLKPQGWQPPRIRALLQEQMR